MMADTPKYYYYKIHVYTRTGRPVSGIKHNTSDNKNVVKGQYEEEARRHYKDNFHYLDIWTMDERFQEVIEYKEKNGLV